MSTGTEHPAPIPESAAHPPPALVPGPFAHALSVGLGVVTVAAAAPTVLIDDVLRGPAAMNGSARGTALVMLLVGVPLLVVGQLATRRDHGWALPIWLGSTAYLLYNAFMLLFATPFNALFLLYVGTFSLALWTLVAILRVAEVAAFGRPGSPVGERRSIAVFTWVVVALNAAAWLRAIVNGLPDTAGAAFLQGTGLTTAPTYVQDLAVWLPLMAVAAYWLWRGLGWGYLVVASLLAMWVVECITIAVDQYLGSIADPAATMVSSSMTPLFVVLALVMAVPTVLLLRRM
ncbi:MAG TPA: hypothetical protein VIU11_22240 [Nakamurella sp.]